MLHSGSIRGCLQRQVGWKNWNATKVRRAAVHLVTVVVEQATEGRREASVGVGINTGSTSNSVVFFARMFAHTLYSYVHERAGVVNEAKQATVMLRGHSLEP